ncbi:COX2 oxidase, partial [Crypturellus undulatus]|nr:COX2 oxidase [Crypturellus undulatus]
MRTTFPIRIPRCVIPIIEELIESHDDAPIAALAVCCLVLYLLTLILTEEISSNTVDTQEVELI